MNRGLLLLIIAAAAVGLFAGAYLRRPASEGPGGIPVQTAAAPGNGSVYSISPSLALGYTAWEQQLRLAAALPPWKREMRLRELAIECPLTQPAAALALARSILRKQDASIFQSQLLVRWAKKDPQSVLAFGLSLKDRGQRQEAISAALFEWARSDFGAAMSWVDKAPRGSERQTFLIAAFRGLAAVAPQTALEKAQLLPFSQRTLIRDMVLISLAATDPKRAMDLAMQTSKKGAQFSRFNGGAARILGGWVGKNPAEALAWLRAQPPEFRRGPELTQAIEIAKAENPANALKLWELMPSATQRMQTLQSILTAWSERDPAALQAWTASRSDPKEKSLGELASALALSNSDPAAAAKALRDVRWDSQNAGLCRDIFANYGKRDPQAAVAAARDVPNASARAQALGGALSSWAETDPAGAAAYSLTLPRGDARNQAAVDIAQQWAQGDPKAALEWIKQAPASAFPRESLLNMIATVGDQVPGAAASYATSLPAGRFQNDLLGRLAGQWANSDFDSALAWVKQLPDGKGRDSALTQISGSWTENAPEDAANYAKNLPSGESRNQMLNMVAASWANTDPKSAGEFALSLPEDDTRSPTIEAVAAGWARTDPAAAAKFVEGLSVPNERELALRAVAQAWAGSDPSAAAEWVSAQPADSGRTAALESILTSWADQSPRDAAEYAAKLSGQEQAKGVSAVVSRLAISDPQMAAGWIGQFPDGPLKVQGEQDLMNGWSGSDPKAAAAWLNALNDASNRDALIGAFANRVAEQAPQLAWQEGLTISDDDQRAAVLQRVAGGWLRADPAGAKAAIEASGLSQDEIDQLLSGGQ